MSDAGEVVRAGERYLHAAALEVLKLHVVSVIAGFHKKNPLTGGISKEELRTWWTRHLGSLRRFAALLVRDKKMEVANDVVRLPGHGVVMKDEESESKKRIKDAFTRRIESAGAA